MLKFTIALAFRVISLLAANITPLLLTHAVSNFDQNSIDTNNCLVGDILYNNGDYVGYIGLECLDDSNYTGIESFCIDGEIVNEEKTLTCDENIVPRCFQCGEKGWGQAICKDQPDPSCETCIEGSKWASMEDTINAFCGPCPGSDDNGRQLFQKMLQSRMKSFQSDIP